MWALVIVAVVSFLAGIVAAAAVLFTLFGGEIPRWG